jgi:hypothetical protein
MVDLLDRLDGKDGVSHPVEGSEARGLASLVVRVTWTPESALAIGNNGRLS